VISKWFKKRQTQKESIVEFVFNIISCWLISVGAALIVDSQYSIQIGLVTILWQTLLTIVAVVLFSRKWWIPIIYFGVLLPVFFLAISISGDIVSFFESFAGFVKWWASGLSYESKWYSEQGFYLVHTFVNIAISILFFAVCRIFKWPLLVVGTVMAFIVVNYAYGHTGYDLLAISFLVAGVFPLIAGDKFQRLKLPDIKNLFGIWGKKWLLVLISTLITAIISFGAFTVANNTEGSVRNRPCSDAVADLQTLSGAYTKEQKKLNISLFDIGLVMNSTYVGGNLYNIKPKPLASTSLTEPTLIKVTSFDTYDGVMWENEFDKSYRVNGFWDYEQNAYFAGEAVTNESFMNIIKRVAPVSKVRINLVQDTFYLPTMGQLIEFEEGTKTTNPVLYDKRGRLFSYYGFKKGYTYTVENISYKTDEKILNVQLKGILKKMNFKPDPLYDKNCDFYKCYTQLPNKVSKSLEKALKKLKLENLSEYEKAYEIANYFSNKNGFMYEREPNNFKRGDDIIDRLFATKKGHCVYYATAMVIMSRKAGIPARFTAGYKTIKNPKGKKQIIDASSPYSWVECYLPNIGWVAFDPNPNMVVNPNNTSKNTVTTGKKSPIPDINVDTDVEKDEKRVAGTNLKWNDKFNTPILIFLALVAVALIICIIKCFVAHKFYEIAAVRKRFKTTSAQAEYYYCDILSQFAWLGFKLQKGETLNELTNRVCGILPPNYANAVCDGINTVEELHYGDITPTEQGVFALFEARKQLEKVLMDKNNKLFYLVKRRLLLKVFWSDVKKYK